MGRPLTPEYEREVGAIARRHGVPLHIDGARFWNAVVAQRDRGVTATDLADPADTVTFCLSKGLGCPVGSMVVGSSEFIDRARRARKLLGGGMRQAGILAAAGLVALSDGPDGQDRPARRRPRQRPPAGRGDGRDGRHHAAPAGSPSRRPAASTRGAS